ncbi:pseudouridine synthase [Streptomyces sp. Wb2n-11]|uniref:pseudouridine synthase n=1 Tax=Streptomyces sp. Wb2n-11 TaxID=1030533 RepID=UPI000A7FCB5C|nr:pseudouridine synthase [Streptomyces sp. Wb2n-11]
MRSSSGRNSGSGNDRNQRGAGKGRDDGQKRSDRPERPDRPRPEERRYDVGRDAPGARGGSGGGAGRGGSGGGVGRGGSGGGAGRGGSGGGVGRGGSGAAGGRGGSAGGAGRGGSTAGSGRGASARGGAKGGPKAPQSSRGAAPRRGPHGQRESRPRELDAKLEERVRERHSKPQVKTPKTFPGAEQEGERLQKVLARAGMGSRRACEELIEQARVEVNGEIVTEQGRRVDVHKDEVKVDGLTVATQSHLFFALNKPAGVVATMGDPDGRQNLNDYVNNRETRLFHVGRLDTETEGIILLTNHGELAHRLTHPKYGVKKTYLAAIQGPLPRDLGKRLKDGIALEDGYARADHFRVVENTGKNYLVEVTLHEGRKHIVRRMLAEAGFPVERLVRTSFGPIPLGDQKSGWLRRLTNTEVGMLMKEVGL